jgi:hypothetical protein
MTLRPRLHSGAVMTPQLSDLIAPILHASLYSGLFIYVDKGVF